MSKENSKDALKMFKNESIGIEKSLSSLGKVFVYLVARKDDKSVHVPYLESKLTRLLKESLETNFKSLLIATVHSGSDNITSTKETLKFADLAS